MNARTSTIINQQFFKFLLPTVLVAMATEISLTVDGIIVGNLLGPEALAAVNLVLPVMALLNTVFVMFGVGGSTKFCMSLGEGQRQAANDCFTFSMLGMAVISIALCIFCLFTSEYLVVFLVKEQKLLSPLVSDYMMASLLSAPLFICTAGFGYFIRAVGRIRLAAMLVIFANIINLAMDVVYIKVFDLGIAGAGLATGTGYLAALFMALCMLRKTEDVKFCRITQSTIRLFSSIFKIGVPSTLYNILFGLYILCINTIVMSYLYNASAIAYSVYNSILNIISMFASGAALAMLPFAGALYGEKDYSGMRFAIKNAMLVGVGSMLLFFMFIEMFPAFISNMFGVRDPELIEHVSYVLRVCTLSLPISGFIFLAIKVFSIVNQKLLATTIAFFECFGLVLCAWFIAALIEPEYIWWAFPVSAALTLGYVCVMVVLVRKKHPNKKGFFLYDFDEHAQAIDITMIQNIDQAIQVSEQGIAFCKNNKVSGQLSTRVGIVLEEMTVNTITQKGTQKKESYIDIRLLINEQYIQIIFKDNGPPYNPLKKRNDDTSFDNIQMALVMASDITYDTILGMNRSIIRINRA